MDIDNVQDDIEVVMLTAALTNILGHDNRGDHPTAVLLMAAWGQHGVLDRSSLRFMRSRKGALSGSDLAKEPGLGTARTYQPGLQSRHQAFRQEMSSEAASSSPYLKAADPYLKAAEPEWKKNYRETLKEDLERNVTLCLHSSFCRVGD